MGVASGLHATTLAKAHAFGNPVACGSAAAHAAWACILPAHRKRAGAGRQNTQLRSTTTSLTHITGSLSV